MQCKKCLGLMIVDFMLAPQIILPCLRCVNCGELIDSQILANRGTPEFDLKGRHQRLNYFHPKRF